MVTGVWPLDYKKLSWHNIKLAYEPFGLEPLQRLADRRPTDADTLAQLQLGPETAGGELERDDQVFKRKAGTIRLVVHLRRARPRLRDPGRAPTAGRCPARAGGAAAAIAVEL
jgi:hypothetical protein